MLRFLKVHIMGVPILLNLDEIREVRPEKPEMGASAVLVVRGRDVDAGQRRLVCAERYADIEHALAGIVCKVESRAQTAQHSSAAAAPAATPEPGQVETQAAAEG